MPAVADALDHFGQVGFLVNCICKPTLVLQCLRVFLFAKTAYVRIYYTKYLQTYTQSLELNDNCVLTIVQLKHRYSIIRASSVCNRVFCRLQLAIINRLTDLRCLVDYRQDPRFLRLPWSRPRHGELCPMSRSTVHLRDCDAPLLCWHCCWLLEPMETCATWRMHALVCAVRYIETIRSSVDVTRFFKYRQQ